MTEGHVASESVSSERRGEPVRFSPFCLTLKDLLTANTSSCNLIGLPTFGRRHKNLASQTRPYPPRLCNSSDAEVRSEFETTRDTLTKV